MFEILKALTPYSEEPQLPLGEVAEKEAVQLFNEVRDMPFEVRPPGKKMTFEEMIEDLRNRRRGACTPKHSFLGLKYRELKIPTLFVTLPFLWQDLPVDYPKNIKNLVGKMPVQYHLALAISSKGKVSLLDATWDPPLKKVGFPISTLGNTLDSTNIGVCPCGSPIFHQTACERWNYIESLKPSMRKTGVELDFYVALNQWLETLRQN